VVVSALVDCADRGGAGGDRLATLPALVDCGTRGDRGSRLVVPLPALGAPPIYRRRAATALNLILATS
jgi:hypothetical protein